jgi:hypothetical protein
MGLVKCVNGFGLFEACGSVEKYLEEKVSCIHFYYPLVLLFLVHCC